MIAKGLLGILCIVAAAPLAATEQNFVVNGDFDTDLSGWQQSTLPLPTWAALDYRGDGNSGSALIENDSADAGIRLYPLTLCITPPAGTYVLSVRGYIASGQTGGRLVLSYAIYNGANCTGNGGGSGGQFLTLIGAWQLQTASVRQVGLATSVEISLGIEKDAAGGSLQGYFDAVIFSDHLFADGFEGQ